MTTRTGIQLPLWRLATGLAVAAALVSFPAPGLAQLPGMPVWNSPSAGTGVVVAGDVGFSDRRGEGTSYALRANAGFGTLNLGLAFGAASPGKEDSPTSSGGTVGLRLLGGGLLPLSLNVQGGYATGEDDISNVSRYTAALGLAAHTPLPGFRLEPWISPGIRFNHRPGDASFNPGDDANFGVALGVNAALGLLGMHAGLDYEDTGVRGGSKVFALGLHLGVGLP